MLYAVVAFLALALGLLLYATRVEPRRMILRRQVLEYEPSQLPLEKLTILHISDLHVRKPDPLVAGMIDRVRGLEPDLILVTGDLIEVDAGTDFCVELLSTLRARLGVYAVLGNHDHWYKRGSVLGQLLHAALNVISFTKHSYNDVPSLVRKLRQSNVNVLINENLRVPVDGQYIWLAGVDDPISERDDLARALWGVPGEDFSILLTHSPELAYAAERQGVDLVLAGHTHGGQIRIPFVGALVSRTRTPVPTVKGPKKMGRTWLHVSPGLGSSVQLRFLSPPEITLLELRRRLP